MTSLENTGIEPRIDSLVDPVFPDDIKKDNTLIEKTLFAAENSIKFPGSTPPFTDLKRKPGRPKQSFICKKCQVTYKQKAAFLSHIRGHVTLPEISLKRCDDSKYIRKEVAFDSYILGQKRIVTTARKKIRPPHLMNTGTLKLKLKLDNSGASNSFEVVNSELIGESNNSDNISNKSVIEEEVQKDSETEQVPLLDEPTIQKDIPIENDLSHLKEINKESPQHLPSNLPCHLATNIMVQLRTPSLSDVQSPHNIPAISPAQPSPHTATQSPASSIGAPNDKTPNESLDNGETAAWNPEETSSNHSQPDQGDRDDPGALLQQILTGQQVNKEQETQIIANEYISIDRLGMQYGCEMCSLRFSDLKMLEEHKHLTGHSITRIPPSNVINSPRFHPPATYGQPPVVPMEQLAQQVQNLPIPPQNMNIRLQYPPHPMTQPYNNMMNYQGDPRRPPPMYRPQAPGNPAMPNGLPNTYTNNIMRPYFSQHPGNMYPMNPNVQNMRPNVPGFSQTQDYAQKLQSMVNMSSAGHVRPNMTMPSMSQSRLNGPITGQSAFNNQARTQMGNNRLPLNVQHQQPGTRPGMPPQSMMQHQQQLMQHQQQMQQRQQQHHQQQQQQQQQQQMQQQHMQKQQQIQQQQMQKQQQKPLGSKPGMSNIRSDGTPQKIRLQKRHSGPVSNPPVPVKQKRLDVLIPDQHDNDDCSVVSVQNRDAGMPFIQNVQGSAQISSSSSTNSSKDSTIHLTDQITLSVRSNKETAPQKSKDAKAVANILATRGITVTPASSRNRKSSSPAISIADEESHSEGSTLDLNDAVSIIPTQKNTFAIPQSKGKSSRPLTVDLTDDQSEINERSRTSSNPLTCHVCKSTFTSQENLSAHVLKNHPHTKVKGVMYKCNKCPTQYATPDALNSHKRTHGSTLSELGLPIVDLKQDGTLSRLQSLGIHNYIPLANLNQQTGGSYGVPIVSVQGAKNSLICNLAALGASDILSLGTVKQLPKS